MSTSVLMSSVSHIQERYSNNRAENSHQRTQYQEQQMKRFKSHKQAQLFLSIHAQINNLFNLDLNLMRARSYRALRECSLNERTVISCA